MELCPMSRKPQLMKHPLYPAPTPQWIVISTLPTSPAPQVAVASRHQELLLIPQMLSKEEQCCSGGLGAAHGLADIQTACVYQSKKRAQCGLSSLLVALRGSLPSNYLFLLSKDMKYLQKYEILETLLLYQIFLQSVHCSKLTSIRCRHTGRKQDRL